MSAIATGIREGLRHRRLAGVFWLSLFATSLVAAFPLRIMFNTFDSGAFREALVRGWNDWAMLSYLRIHGEELHHAIAAMIGGLVLFALVQIFLTGGLLRALIAGRTRPVFRLVVSESTGLFKANLWATVRFALTASIWLGLLVAVPHALIAKLARDTAPPHSFWPTFAFWWTLVVSALVLLNTGLRFDLARVALARGEAVNARGAYRVSKRRLRGNRPSAFGVAIFWLAIAAIVQVFFTWTGLRWNPRTDLSTFGLFVYRQFGFWVLAAARVGFWGSLMEWENEKRTR